MGQETCRRDAVHSDRPRRWDPHPSSTVVIHSHQESLKHGQQTTPQTSPPPPSKQESTCMCITLHLKNIQLVIHSPNHLNFPSPTSPWGKAVSSLLKKAALFQRAATPLPAPPQGWGSLTWFQSQGLLLSPSQDLQDRSPGKGWSGLHPGSLAHLFLRAPALWPPGPGTRCCGP